VRQASAIFFFRRWHTDHRAAPWFATLIGQQRADQCLPVELVGLGPAPAARSCDRGGINDVTLDSFSLKDPMNPKPIQASFLDRNNRVALFSTLSCLALQFAEPSQ